MKKLMKKVSVSLFMLTLVSNVAFAVPENILPMSIQPTMEISVSDNGNISSKTITSYNASKARNSNINTTVALPARYNSATLGNVSPVKDQRSSGTCWAFSGIGAMESFMLKNHPVKNADGTKNLNAYDFSENHMQYMESEQNNNPFGFITGIGENSGGNALMVSTYLMNRTGLVDENDDVFNPVSTMREYSVSKDKPLNDYVAKSIVELPDLNPTDALNPTCANKIAHRNDTKRMIMDYGSVMCAVKVSSTATTSYFVDKDNKYLYNNSYINDTDHMVLAVGWDDTISRTNFKMADGTMPPVDGAFIIKNSWGTYACDKGYFYLSYADVFATRNIYAIADGGIRDSSEIIYSYDPYPVMGYSEYKEATSVRYGNIFKRKTANEVLSSTVFYAAPGDTYDIYLINGNVTKTIDGQLEFQSKDYQAKQTIIEGFSPKYSGYYTIDLNTPLKVDSTFSIMVVSTGYGKMWLENNYFNFINKVTAKPGESFSYLNNSNIIFNDSGENYNSNFCVKAITKTTDSFFNIEKADLTNKDGILKTTLNPGEDVYIYPVTEMANCNGKQYLLGVYNNNKLVTVLSKSIANGNNHFEYKNIPANFSSYNFKLFAVDSFDNIKPLGTSKSLIIK